MRLIIHGNSQCLLPKLRQKEILGDQQQKRQQQQRPQLLPQQPPQQHLQHRQRQLLEQRREKLFVMFDHAIRIVSEVWALDELQNLNYVDANVDETTVQWNQLSEQRQRLLLQVQLQQQLPPRLQHRQ